MSDDLKEIMQAKGESGIDPEVEAKLAEIKDNLLETISELKSDYEDNKIPFVEIKEQTGYKYQLISDVILHLIMEKSLTGFINDGGTDRFDDDVLILREKRMVDEMEPEYRTGYA